MTTFIHQICQIIPLASRDHMNMNYHLIGWADDPRSNPVTFNQQASVDGDDPTTHYWMSTAMEQGDYDMWTAGDSQALIDAIEAGEIFSGNWADYGMTEADARAAYDAAVNEFTDRETARQRTQNADYEIVRNDVGKLLAELDRETSLSWTDLMLEKNSLKPNNTDDPTRATLTVGYDNNIRYGFDKGNYGAVDPVMFGEAEMIEFSLNQAQDRFTIRFEKDGQPFNPGLSHMRAGFKVSDGDAAQRLTLRWNDTQQAYRDANADVALWFQTKDGQDLRFRWRLYDKNPSTPQGRRR